MGILVQEYENKQMLIDDDIGCKILDAATEIIEKEGYDNLTIRKVAKLSGCSNTAIYVRFKDKDELVRALAALNSKPFLLVMDESYAAGEDLFTNIKRITHAALKKVYLMDIGSVNMQMYYRAGMLPEENPFVIKLEGYIKNAVAKGEIQTTNTRTLAYAIESSFWGTAYMLKSIENKGIGLEQALRILDFSNNLHFSGLQSKVVSEDFLWEMLKEKKVDVDKALERMKGNKEVYKEFLKEFFEDPDIEDLSRAIEESNAREAFEYAHGLKGMAANLGLDAIHEHLSVLVEILRPGNLTGAKEAYDQVMKDCQEIIDIL